MAKSRFELPAWTKPKDVQEALRYHYDASSSELQVHAYNWTRTHWFTQGLRRLNIQTGPAYVPTQPRTDHRNRRGVRVDKIASILQNEMGRLMQIDIGPSVIRPPGVSIDAVRGTALSQVALDNFWARYNKAPFELALRYMLAAYGTVGVGAFDIGQHEGGVFGTTLVLAPPWELRSLPGEVTSVDQVGGLCWSRWVPYSWLKAQYKNLFRWPKREDHEKLHLQEVVTGSRIQTDFAPGSSTTGAQTRERVIGSAIAVPDVSSMEDEYPMSKQVEFKQYWVTGDDYSCLRWCVMLGDWLALDVDYSDPKCRADIGYDEPDLPISPMQVARYLTVGSFYGKGVLERVTELTKEFEDLYSTAIQDVKDSVRFRKLMVPTSSGINERALEAPNAAAIIRYQPDYAATNARPEFVGPPSLGDIPGRLATFTMNLIDGLVQHGPMLAGQAPGRVDTAGGVAIIAEQQQVPLLAVGESLAGAMTGVWKAVLGNMRRRITEDDTFTLTRIDESMLGLRYDKASGSVVLDAESTIPKPQQVEVTIRNKNPKPKSALKAELDDLLAKGLLSKSLYVIASYKHGLELPFATRTWWEQYVTAWVENLIMFGDGETPGETITDSEADLHPIHLLALQEVMASLAFRAASLDVQSAFINHKNYHRGSMQPMPDPLMTTDGLGMPGPANPLAAQLASQQIPPEMGAPIPPDEFSVV